MRGGDSVWGRVGCEPRIMMERLKRNSENIAFTLGLGAIVIGCFLIDVSIGFLVPGALVCGLLVWKRTRVEPNGDEGGGDGQ